MNPNACTIAFTGDHDDPDWHLTRLTGIGASEIAAVLGENPWCSPLQLWGEKTGKLAARDLSGVEAVEWGNRLEPVIVAAFEERTGRTVRIDKCILRSVACPHMLASLDAVVTYEDGTQGPLEIKAVGARQADAWENGSPEHYRLQVQQQIAVTGSKRGTIAALIGGQRLVWEDVERDEVTIRRIEFAINRFCQMVDDGTPPESDGSESSRTALGSLYPHDDGSTVVLAGEMLDVFDELDDVSSKLKELDTRKIVLENAVKAAMGSATRGVLVNGGEFTWKTQRMPERVLKASECRVLRRKAPKQDRKVA